MRIEELKKLRGDLIEVINENESEGRVMPSCVDDLKMFLTLLDLPEFENLVGDDPEVPCWKYVSDGGFDNFPGLRAAFEEFSAEIKGFRP